MHAAHSNLKEHLSLSSPTVHMDEKEETTREEKEETTRDDV